MDINNANIQKGPHQSILDKIMKLNNNLKLHGGGVKPTKKLIDKITTSSLDNVINSNLNIWRISDALLLIGECFDDKTNKISRKNNVVEITEYLNKNFGENYLVYSFRKNTNVLKFKNIQFYEHVRFNLNTCLNIARTSKCWMKINKNGIVVIEIQDELIENILLIICIILSYSNVYTSAICSYNRIVKANPEIFHPSEIVLRYLNYFDQLIKIKNTQKIQKKILSQVIISTIPDILVGSEKNIILKVEISNKEYMITSNCYTDENFIIFSHVEIEMCGEAVFSLVFDDGKNSVCVFELYLNTFFYTKGMYRFKKNDVVTSNNKFNIADCISEDFLVDLIFVEDETEKIANTFIIDENILNEMKIIVERMENKFSEEKITKFLNMNMEMTLAKYCAAREYTAKEAIEFVKSLESMGLKFRVPVVKPVKVPIVMSEKIENIKIETIRCVEKREMISYFNTKYECNKVHEKFNDIAFIVEKKIEIPAKSIKKKLFHKDPNNSNENGEPVEGLRRRFFQREQNKVCDKDEPKKLAIKPLYWDVLSTSELTFFEEIKTIDPGIDFETFEGIFCKETQNENEEKTELRRMKRRDDQKLFLISLSLKHLELKKITALGLSNIINYNPELLEMEDLMNIERILLKKEEYELLATVPKEERSFVEESLLKFNKIEQIKESIEMLMFKRRFCEEAMTIQGLVNNFEIVLRSILKSPALKILLKTVLDIGNAINYKYSKKKKISVGYKIDGLMKCLNYTGKNDVKILDFIVQNFRRRNVDIENFVREFELIEDIQKEEFGKLKDQINKQISDYKEQLVIFATLDEIGKSRYRKFLSQVSETLSKLCDQYGKCQELINEIVIKFGEVESKSINKIIMTLSDVIKLVKLSNK